VTSALPVAVLLGLVAVPALATAQSIRGMVRDSVTKRPLAGVTVAAFDRDSRIGQMLTADNGAVELGVGGERVVRVEARRIGFSLFQTVVRVPRDGATLDIEMRPVPVDLKPIVSTDSQGSRLTSGREFVRRHLALGKGLIVSGVDIARSGLTISEFLGGLEDMKLTKAPQPGLPAIPGRFGFLTAKGKGRSPCLYARINRTSLFEFLMDREREHIDDLLIVQDVAAVEIYRDPREIPPEWRAEMLVQDLFLRRSGAQDYVIGHTGAVVDWLRIDRDYAAFKTIALFTNRPNALTRRPVGQAGTPRSREVRYIPRFSIIPQCAFLQVWTRSAWE
jgi:hypothetical protein